MIFLIRTINVTKIKEFLYKYPLYHICRDFYYAHIFPLYYKLVFLKAVIKKGFKVKAILVYPELPKSRFVLSRITHTLGYHITNKPNSNVVAVINNEDATLKKDDDVLKSLSMKYKIINYNCHDISKKRIASAFEKTFGYNISINPFLEMGYFLKKSDKNAQHDGKIIMCPIDKIEEGFVYQKFINTEYIKDILIDIRAPVYCDIIPFLYLKYRYKQYLCGRKIIKDEMVEVHEVLSQEEVEKILLFCKEIGLDFGELDILRDKDDGRLYIVDANTTPGNLARCLSKKEKKLALKRLALTFEKAFLLP